MPKKESWKDWDEICLHRNRSCIPRLKQECEDSKIFSEYLDEDGVVKPISTHCDACLSMLYKTRYKKVSYYSKEWEGPGVRIDDTIIKSFYLSNGNVSDAKSLINGREETYFTVPYEISRFPEEFENPEISMFNPDYDHVLMVTPDDVPKGYGRMIMTDTKSTSQVSVRGFLYA